MGIIKCIKILLLWLLITDVSMANSRQDSAELQQCNNLVEKGNAAKNTGRYTEALEYYSKAEILAENGQWQQQLFDIKNNIGVVYVSLSNYNEARGYYQQALQIARKEPKDNLVMVLNNIANSYSYERDYPNALRYFKAAYNDPKANNTPLSKTFLIINISDTYNKLGNYNEARNYLLEVANFKKPKQVDLFWRINYAETFFIEGRFKEAEKMMLQLLQDIGEEKDADGYVYIAELLSKIYERQGMPDKAISYAEKGLQYTPKMRGKIDLYNRLSSLYFNQKKYIVSYQYKDSVIATKDSIASLASKELFETNKIKLRIQRYQNELKLYKERQSAERTIFIILIAFSLLLIFLIYRALKNRIVKQRQERTIAQNQQKITALEMEQLQNKIAEKNRRLSAKALYLSGRNELIEDVINSVSQIQEVSQNQEVTTYIKSLRSYLKTDVEWDDFISYFEEVNPAFLSKLKAKHAQLNPADIRFICYLYMNLDLKEISNIFSITVEAGKKRKQRIAKKLDVEADNLHDYIVNLGEALQSNS